MPRPIRCRRIGFMPGVTYFKPTGIQLTNLQESVLTFAESEAIRLKDYLNVDQTKAAKKMRISQPTFNRLLSSARKKIADAIVNGKAIKIQGGNYKMVTPRGRNFGRGRGRMGGPLAAGPGGVCKCPSCGYEESQIRGQPCNQKKCPKCGTLMVRK